MLKKRYNQLFKEFSNVAIYSFRDVINGLISAYKNLEKSDIDQKKKILKNIKKILQKAVYVDNLISDNLGVESVGDKVKGRDI